MITRVRIKNYKSLADVDVTLGPLTVLVGKNGSGKSAFLDALRFVRDALENRFAEAISARGGFAQLYTWSPKAKQQPLEFWFEVDNIGSDDSDPYVAEYGFAISFTNQSYHVVSEVYKVGKSRDELQTIFEMAEEDWKLGPLDPFYAGSGVAVRRPMQRTKGDLFLPSYSIVNEDAAYLRHFLTSSQFYTLPVGDTLRQPQALLHFFPLAEDGGNLASFLSRMQESESEQAEWRRDLVKSLQIILGDVTDYRIEETGEYLVTRLEHQRTSSDPAWFSLAQESDGTIRVLALLAALYQTGPFSMVGIEEPELALYPAAMESLAEIIEEAAQTHRRQVLITTQSPDFISKFDVKDLRVVTKVDGATYIGPVGKTERKILDQELFTTGDLLRIRGLDTDIAPEVPETVNA